MSDADVTNDDDSYFQIHHNGKFEVEYGNILSYVGGENHTLVCSPRALFTNLPEVTGSSLYGQRIWYKLPFEDFTELKMICSGDAMFEKMCESVMWTKMAEIFMESEDVFVGADDGLVDVAVDGLGAKDGLGSEDGLRVEDDDRDDANGDEEMLEEEARVEENVAGFVDEEEDDHAEDTPPNSDCEDGGGRKFPRCKKGSGDLRLGQVFDSIPEFKEAVIDYVLKNGCNLKFTRWRSLKCEVKCAVGGKGKDSGDDNEADQTSEDETKGCPFRLYCSYEKPIRTYLLKTFNDEHTCIPDGYSKVVKGGIIAKLFLNDLRRDPTIKPKAMQEAIEEKYNLTVSNDQCRKAKKKALKMIQDEHNEQFARIKDYKLELLRSNPDSTVEVRTVTKENGVEMFDKIYVCLAVLKRTWLAHCRPIFGIDGCFLKNNIKGQLLAVVGRDADNQFFPIAWAVVQVENTESWIWFVQKLKNDLKLLDGYGFSLISDRQKGLLNAVEQELPRIEHRMCARHIYGNLRRIYPGKELPKNLFWAIAKSFNKGEYDLNLKALKAFDEGVYEAVMQRNPENCSRAFFSCISVCEDVSNNFSESYNSSINKAREMPLIEMLETVRRLTMIRMDIRRKKARKWQGKYSEKVTKTIKDEEKHRKHCRVVPSGNGVYEVIEHTTIGHKVDMNAKTCACRRWSITWIPCRHALRVILQKKLDPLDYVSDWYLTSVLRKQYDDSIRPVNGIKFWRRSGEATIQPPPREDPLPTKKQKKRIKGKNESPQKRKKGMGVDPTEKRIKLSREGRTSHCGNCGHSGHNTRSCPNHGCHVYRPKNQASGLSQGEGPSQPSQND